MVNDSIQYITGLDLGKTAEHTALAVLEQTTGPDPAEPGRKVKHYAVRHLQRFALGTPFTEVCTRLRAMFFAPPLAQSTLAVDQTAVGQPVVNLLRRARLKASIRPVTITAGNQASINEEGCWLVPKKELVSTLQILLQSRRIKVAPRLPESQTLMQELLSFRVKVTLSPNDTLEAWREGPHDDLVLAVAIAAWQSEHLREFWIRCCDGSERRPKAPESPGEPAVEVSAAMGTVYTIPADPRPKGIDIRPGAPGWQRAW